MKKEKLIINGNAFYEIDLECFEKKKKDSKHFPDKKAGIHSSQHTQISAATTVIATSTTEQEQYDNDPAGIIAIAAAASVSTSIVSAQTHQTDDPENTITGVISKKTVSIATATVVITSASFITASTICSS